MVRVLITATEPAPTTVITEEVITDDRPLLYSAEHT